MLCHYIYLDYLFGNHYACVKEKLIAKEGKEKTEN